MYATVTCGNCGRNSSNAPSKIKCPSIKMVLEHLQKCDPEGNWDFVYNSKGQWQIGRAGA